MCDTSVRKPKHHHWRSKTATRHAVLPDQVTTESTSGLHAASSWSVSGTSQWQYPTDVIVSSASDLLHLQQFLVGKVYRIGALLVERGVCLRDMSYFCYVVPLFLKLAVCSFYQNKLSLNSIKAPKLKSMDSRNYRKSPTRPHPFLRNGCCTLEDPVWPGITPKEKTDQATAEYM